MKSAKELRLKHWKRVEELGLWRFGLLYMLCYGLTIALMLAFVAWQRVPNPDWMRFATKILPLFLLGGFLLGAVSYFVKMSLYRRHKRRLHSHATLNI